MSVHRTLSRNLACLIAACLSLTVFSGPASACRLYAAIGVNMPDGMLYNHLRGDSTNFPYSLYYLSYTPYYNPDGWGIGYYPHFGDSPTIARGQPKAHDDPQFTASVTLINTPPEPQIVMAHIRAASSGCMGVPDPHPFYRDKVGKRWLFEHNGGDSISLLKNFIGTTYLAANPPNGSDIPECASSPVGSEYYFLYYLKTIEEYGWNVVNGLTAAIKTYDSQDPDKPSMNFIMSDGQTLWAFRRGTDTSHTLNYLYSEADGYAAVASRYPSASRGSWIEMAEYQLIVFRPGASPAIINDVRTYCPGDINGDRQVDAADLATLAGSFGRSGGGDLDFDGVVDGADVAAMIAAYGEACP